MSRRATQTEPEPSILRFLLYNIPNVFYCWKSGKTKRIKIMITQEQREAEERAAIQPEKGKKYSPASNTLSAEEFRNAGYSPKRAAQMAGCTATNWKASNGK